MLLNNELLDYSNTIIEELLGSVKGQLGGNLYHPIFSQVELPTRPTKEKALRDAVPLSVWRPVPLSGLLTQVLIQSGQVYHDSIVLSCFGLSGLGETGSSEESIVY
jgi:hypothetical protein